MRRAPITTTFSIVQLHYRRALLVIPTLYAIAIVLTIDVLTIWYSVIELFNSVAYQCFFIGGW